MDGIDDTRRGPGPSLPTSTPNLIKIALARDPQQQDCIQSHTTEAAVYTPKVTNMIKIHHATITKTNSTRSDGDGYDKSSSFEGGYGSSCPEGIGVGPPSDIAPVHRRLFLCAKLRPCLLKNIWTQHEAVATFLVLKGWDRCSSFDGDSGGFSQMLTVNGSQRIQKHVPRGMISGH